MKMELDAEGSRVETDDDGGGGEGCLRFSDIFGRVRHELIISNSPYAVRVRSLSVGVKRQWSMKGPRPLRCVDQKLLNVLTARRLNSKGL